jgi:CheY-like chemotaxis protein
MKPVTPQTEQIPSTQLRKVVFGGSLNILIVEDSLDDAALMILELGRAGYEVASKRVETESALRAALAQKIWDAVLCDYTLPQFSGPQALPIVNAADADLPFIYVSGTIGEDMAVEALKSGAHDYVLKNNLARLAPAFERALREAQLRRERRILEADRERLVVELKAALMDVKRLSGLLPICAGCKKIRTSRNEWQPIEVYIQEHSIAQFSHGLWPDCLSRHGFSAVKAIRRRAHEQAAPHPDG